MNNETNPLTVLPADLHLPGVSKIDAMGLTLSPGLSLQAALATGGFLQTCAKAVQLWLADFRRQTILLLGQADADELAGQLKLEIQVPSAMPGHDGRRWDSLSPEHYFVAGKECADEAAAEVWLEAAAKADLNPQQLRASIRAGEIRAGASPSAGTRLGLPTIQRVVMEFGLFEARVDVGRYSLEDCRLVIELMQGILDWLGTVRSRKAELEAVK